MAGSWAYRFHYGNIRTQRSLKVAVGDTAHRSGRSVSQEIESRLELSFQEERILGGKSTALLSKLISSTIGLIEQETERDWTEDRMTWEAVNAAVQRIISWFQPSLDFDIWDKYRDSALLPFAEAAWAVQEHRERMKGLEDAYDWHHLRHVAASNWLNDGIDLKRLQTWIGHENIQLTIDVYGHLILDAKKDAALAAGAEKALLG